MDHWQVRLTAKTLALILFFIVSLSSWADDWHGHDWQGTIDDDGHIMQLVFNQSEGVVTIPFSSRVGSKGPTFYINRDGKDTLLTWTRQDDLHYACSYDGLECRLNFASDGRWPALKIVVSNKGHVPFQPTKAGLKVGVDTYMEKYPEWNDRFFPTLMYNTPTHFYGYMQSPSGHRLAFICRQPIASWSVDYNKGYQDPAPHWFMGHRILSLNLDLINSLPLPEHCPQQLWNLDPGDSLSWCITMMPVDNDDFARQLATEEHIPMFQLDRTSYDVGDSATFLVYAIHPKLFISDGQKREIDVKLSPESEGCWRVDCRLDSPGLYEMKLYDGDLCVSGCLTAHSPWSWCLRKAREAALKYKQKPTSHAESWYGFYSAFIAAQYFPDSLLDKKLDERFERLFVMLHDTVDMKPRYYQGRIQNTSTTIGLLVARYKAHKRLADINRASRLADWLIDFSQAKNGAYMNGRTMYTSVIYIAKSLMELYEVEMELGEQSATWRKCARRHYASVKRAIDQLVDAHGNFETEGEMTYEDGMISCSALQIGQFALMQTDKKEKDKYTQAMLELLRGHDCLTQLEVPDARRRGGTMRFWEAQYDVQMLPNMFNSPHGWSGWRCYATYYAYLLTGDVKWLLQTYNAVGAFSNLIDYRTGKLRWAFVVDPYLHVKQTCEPDQHYTADSVSFGNPHPELYPTREFVIGEQYVGMISDWQGVNTQDNDVHEVFKCIGETVLTHAFIVENQDGTISAFNCKVVRDGNRLDVSPNEPQVKSLHCNLSNPFTITFQGTTKALPQDYCGWMVL